MKNTSIDTQLIESAPHETVVDDSFTSAVMSKINTHQDTTSSLSQGNPISRLFLQIQRLPKPVIAVLAIASLTLLGGTVYATYKILWEQPSVTVTAPSSNQFGRDQVTARLEKCGQQTNQAEFEVKSGSTLDKDEIGKILQARCEMEIIRTAIGENDGQADVDKLPEAGISQSSTVMLHPSAGKIVKMDDAHLSISGGKHTPSENLTLNQQTQFIIEGMPVSRKQLHPGDTVLFVKDITTRDTTKQDENGQYVTEGTPTSSKILYVIKPSLSFEYYNVDKQNQIAYRQPCVGNPQDSCIQTQQIDLYAHTVDAAKNERRTIQGVITGHKGGQLTLQSSSGRVFAVTTPIDIVRDFNTNKSKLYDNAIVSRGDLLQVSYYGEATEHELTEKNIESIQLGIDLVSKTSKIKKY